MKQYTRNSLQVGAVRYEPEKGMEDGFELFSKVVTNGWVVADGLIKITRADGNMVCPFIQNRRGVVFIRENDYIIYEDDGERHVCGADKFDSRFTPLEES